MTQFSKISRLSAKRAQTRQSAQKLANFLKTPNLKPQSLSKLKAKLDKVFSIYIRMKFADKEGYCTCYTCPKRLPWQSMQNGHFVSRSYLAVRWDENNCRPQCVGCNVFASGRPLEFEEHLKNEIGDVAVEDLKSRRNQIVKLTPDWYINKISEYEAKIKAI